MKTKSQLTHLFGWTAELRSIEVERGEKEIELSLVIGEKRKKEGWRCKDEIQIKVENKSDTN